MTLRKKRNTTLMTACHVFRSTSYSPFTFLAIGFRSRRTPAGIISQSTCHPERKEHPVKSSCVGATINFIQYWHWTSRNSLPMSQMKWSGGTRRSKRPIRNGDRYSTSLLPRRNISIMWGPIGHAVSLVCERCRKKMNTFGKGIAENDRGVTIGMPPAASTCWESGKESAALGPPGQTGMPRYGCRRVPRSAPLCASRLFSARPARSIGAAVFAADSQTVTVQEFIATDIRGCTPEGAEQLNAVFLP